MNAGKSRRPADPVMKDCDHCGGDGEVMVHCYDCGDELYTDSIAATDRILNPECADLCKGCLLNRSELG